MTLSPFVTALFAGLLLAAPQARAQGNKPADPPSEATPEAPADPAQTPEDDPDQDVNKVEPDFTVVNLPTTLRMPRGKVVFWLTHRFFRPLGAGDFGDLAADLFGFDASAQIGLGLRVGVARGLQAAIYRTNDRTIQFSGEYSLVTQDASRPLGLAALVGVEGQNNFSDAFSPALGIVVSRAVGTRLALYAQPIWVGNTHPSHTHGDGTPELDDGESTFLVGVGARVRLTDAFYAVGEYAPRAAGYAPYVGQISFGFEGRVGGHAFQLNVSNNGGSTFGQIARGAFNNDDWFIGFNLSRKFW